MVNTASPSSSSRLDTSSTTAGDRFIAAIRAASFDSAVAIYSSDARLDATVPGWRFKLTGQQAVSEEYGRWFAAPSDFAELRRHATPDGEVVEYSITWTEDDMIHGAHHAHVLILDREADRITEDHVFCGGRWPASLLDEMSAPLFVTEG